MKRDIGGDNELEIVCAPHGQFYVYELHRDNQKVMQLHGTFDTYELASKYANLTIQEEENYSGIEHDLFPATLTESN